MTTPTAGLESVINVPDELIDARVLATRVTNALLLAQAMGLDMTEPVQAQRVLRHLASVERYVKSGLND